MSKEKEKKSSKELIEITHTIEGQAVTGVFDGTKCIGIRSATPLRRPAAAQTKLETLIS